MSKDNLWAVVGRARCDIDFSGKLRLDFDQAVKAAGYVLDSDEMAKAREMTKFRPIEPSEVYPGIENPFFNAADVKKLNELRMKSFQRQSEFTDYMIESAKRTFSFASKTYNSISLMNWLTFLVGLALFCFSAAYALVGQTKAYSILFAGMGVTSFITSFVLRPPEQTQRALSHLVETELAFMNYFEQLYFWEAYANIQVGSPPSASPANIEKASVALMDCAQRTMAMMNRYVNDQNNCGHNRERGPSTLQSADPSGDARA